MNKPIKFNELTSKLKYPPNVKGILSTYHADIVNYVMNHFEPTYLSRSGYVRVINSVTYAILSGDGVHNWDPEHPLDFECYDDEEMKPVLGELFLRDKNIEWGSLIPSIKEREAQKPKLKSVDTTDTAQNESKSETRPEPKSKPESRSKSESRSKQASKPSNNTNTNNNVNVSGQSSKFRPAKSASYKKSVSNTSIKPEPAKSNNTPETTNKPEQKVSPTPKEDLYLRPPSVPQFYYNKVWCSGIVDNTQLVIYESKPEIPTKQNEISATTNADKLTQRDLRKLYPNRVIHTRAESLYEKVSGLEYDEVLGVILPVEGFTSKQIKDNIVKYPHFYQLCKMVDDQPVNFYKTIEINGELYNTLEIWSTLPESKKIPRSSEFIKEYVIRRYLLERDIKHIEHKYPMYGSLDPYITLFMPASGYKELGYSDTDSIVKQCVAARVSYKRTRNPVMRRLGYLV